ncbi:DNA-3-methyladenine glycosylase family protein [Pelagibacterium xiamenense]|uniref:DNA-3-methyladenine glycosylase family protein n=1 Tax=Pelagibacterium xiamenense TaxID=2901140 RepID=UPI001E422502|nr:DNA-3-methyladenine glycosylase [Pelagibacterium xiamenense]MCD7061309.1 DNA-3-methyladenine glycosylase [Pelagibacterium xiamenense]
MRLHTEEALSFHLEGLAKKDERLARAIARAGAVSLRTAPRGFEGMARIICGQQLSVASARAIWGRVEALGAIEANAYLSFDEPTLRATGLSRSKYQTIRGVAEAVAANELDFARIEDLPAEDAITTLTKLKGIGPWTAEIYLLFCAGHPDVFPAGDLALQKAVAHAFELPDLPPAKALIGIAEPWSPHRGAAALMFWRYFSAMKNSDAWDAL